MPHLESENTTTATINVLKTDGTIGPLKLDEDKNVLILFYAEDFVYMAREEMLEFSDRFDEFKDANCQVSNIVCFLLFRTFRSFNS